VELKPDVRLTIAICFLTALFEGIDLQAAGVAAPILLPLLRIGPAQAGLFFGASTFGLLLGAVVGGVLADRFGRKRLLIVALVMFGVFSLATSLARDLDGLIALRFFTGLGIGGALPNIIALASEAAPAGGKGLAVGLMFCGLPLGNAVASLIALAAPGDWRLVFELGGAAPLALAPLVVWGLRDRFVPPDRSVVRPPTVWRSLSEGGLVATALLWTGFGLTLLILYLLVNWLPTMLIARGAGKPLANGVQVLFSLAGAVAGAAAGRAVDSPARAPILGLAALATLAGLLLLANVPAQPAAMLAIGALLGGAIAVQTSALYALAPRLYPQASRGTGVGAAVAVGRVGSVVGPLLAGQWLGARHSVPQVLEHLVPILLIGASATVLLSLRRSDLAQAAPLGLEPLDASRPAA
jgi:AAHS family 3-hydroxyphenylpropionic acid transporter